MLLHYNTPSIMPTPKTITAEEAVKMVQSGDRLRLKYLILILLFGILYTSSMGQGVVLDDRPECAPFGYITIRNGELPQYVTTVLKFPPNVSIDSVVCDARYGHIIRCSHDMTELCSIIPDSSLVAIEYRIEYPVKWEGNKTLYDTRIYCDTLYWNCFKSIEVVCINDLNKKRQTYSIYYKLQPPWCRIVTYKKSYRVGKARFGRTIFRGMAPTQCSEKGKVY